MAMEIPTLCHPLHSFSQVKHLTKFRTLAAFHLLFLLYFFQYRLFGSLQAHNLLWRIAVICEIFFGIVWILDGVAKCFQIKRKAYLERLLCRGNIYSELPNMDVFITTADPWKEPPLVVANTVISVLAADYSPNKLCCYVSDDGGSPYTFYAILEAYQFAKKWVPFCKKYCIHPSAPTAYFACNPFENKNISPSFAKEQEELQREYNDLRLNLNTSMKTGRIPKEAQMVFDELSGSVIADPNNHLGIVKVIGDKAGGLELPQLIYVSREKRKNFKHHFKAGALNALLRVSAVMSNGPFILNLDCDMYMNDPQALYQALCFYLDSSNNRVGFIQFPQRFSGATDPNNLSFVFDVIYRGLDGLQGPFCVGTACVVRREALYGYKPDALLLGAAKLKGLYDQKPETSGEYYNRKFGGSHAFRSASVFPGNIPDRQIWSEDEIASLITCEYEAHTEWGQKVGWMYGTSTEDILTGLTVHRNGWRSIYYSPKSPAFVGSAPTRLPDMINQCKRWSMGMIEILLSKNGPIFSGRGHMMPLQWVCYLYYCTSNLSSIPLFLYSILPTFGLLTGQPYLPKIWDTAILRFFLLVFSAHYLSYVEHGWIGLDAKNWWNEKLMANIFTATSSLAASIEVISKVVGVRGESTFIVTPKLQDNDVNNSKSFGLAFDDSWTLVAPTVVVLMNIIGVLAFVWRKGVFYYGELSLCLCILVNMWPMVKGLIKSEKKGGLSTSMVLKAFLCVFILLIPSIM
eukprot:Gb_31675 [translate_table: standard]